ncbi:MAG: hypothetical protein WC438_01505 [Candidatus Pacearchaeota archaeon]
MKIKADLHNHGGTLLYNGDFNKVIDRAHKKLGFNGILGWINFADNRYETLVSKKGYERQDLGNAVYVPEKNILVLRGQEIGTKQGHLLVLGLKENLKDQRTLEDTLKEAKDNNGIIIADHPFYFEGLGKYLIKNPDLIEDFDAIEIHNGCANFYPFNANKKARIFYNHQTPFDDLGSVSFSDGHSLNEIGSSYTCLENIDFSDSPKLLDSLKTAIKSHKDISRDKQHNSRFRTLEHIWKLSSVILLHKLGINLGINPNNINSVN